MPIGGVQISFGLINVERIPGYFCVSHCNRLSSQVWKICNWMLTPITSILQGVSAVSQSDGLWGSLYKFVLKDDRCISQKKINAYFSYISNIAILRVCFCHISITDVTCSLFGRNPAQQKKAGPEQTQQCMVFTFFWNAVPECSFIQLTIFMTATLFKIPCLPSCWQNKQCKLYCNACHTVGTLKLIK